jgi:trehalose 6-phosphate phosphatase
MNYPGNPTSLSAPPVEMDSGRASDGEPVYLDAPWVMDRRPVSSDGERPASPDWMRHWPDIQAHILKRPRLLLALGFDGILSPTVAQPNEAALPEDVHALLSKFAITSRTDLAFVSGRSLRDIQTRVGLANVYYVGNHGMEVRGPGIATSDGLAVSCRADLVDAVAFLTRCTKRLSGVVIEDKGLTVTAHWRLANPEDAAALRQLIEVIVSHHPRLRIFAGEACWELRARASWNKGDALRQILMHLGLTPADTIYIGEEFTDEDAFASLSDGLSFCVGGGAASAARYRLPDIAAARQLLFCVLCAVHGIPLR